MRWAALYRRPPILRGVSASQIRADHAANQARMNAIGQQRPDGHRPRHALRLARSDEVIGLRCQHLIKCTAGDDARQQLFGPNGRITISALTVILAMTNSRASTGPSTSLRANGSRECAPDDRLREAIQCNAN